MTIDAIEHPDNVVLGYSQRKIYQKKLGIYVLRVVVEEADDYKGTSKVITAYKAQRVRDMEYKYDKETDILTIKLADEKPEFGEERENIITQYSKDNKPVEIEILDAGKTVVKMLEAIVSR